MSPSDRDRHIAEILARHRRLLEERWPTGPVTMDEIERLVEEISREMDREIEQRILHDQQPRRTSCAACPTCGRAARYRRMNERVLISTHGEYPLARAYYYCATCRRGFAPFDRQLGLDGGATTPPARLLIVEAGTKETFVPAAATLARHRGIQVSAATVKRVTVATGTALAQAQQEQARRHQAGALPVPPVKPQRLYVTIDGLYLPVRDPWKRDGSLGPLVCRWQECKLAAVYAGVPDAEGRDRVDERSYIGTLDVSREFGPRLGALAHEHGHHLARDLVVLADGAVWIETLGAAQFPHATWILDYVHAQEHLFSVAHAQFGEGSEAARAWMTAREAELREDGVEAVLEAIAAWCPRTQEQRELQRREYNYVARNAERMRYGSYLRQGYQIGRGVVESACRHVVGSRADQAGMHWSPSTVEAVVCLRTALRSSHPVDLRPYVMALAA
jgi:hypothetical protein